MAKQWKCARCGTENDESTLTCSNCRMIRGAVVVPSAFDSPQPASPEEPAALNELSPAAASGEPAPSWLAGATPSSEPANRSLWRRIPLGLVFFALLIGVGAVGAFFFNASRSSTGEIDRAGDMMATDLRVGDCFDSKNPTAEEVTDVTAKPCTVAHEYELFFSGSLPEGAYPPESTFETYMQTNCVEAFNAYVGRTFADSELDIYWLYPLEDAWNSGDRSVQCAAYHPEDALLITTLKGSNR